MFDACSVKYVPTAGFHVDAAVANGEHGGTCTCISSIVSNTHLWKTPRSRLSLQNGWNRSIGTDFKLEPVLDSHPYSAHSTSLV